ncbi:hypothetical protein [Paraburkholderia hospita]|uniref:hypothetical protein n=1 Tax=Paraburkholderia hospita TaxID=169430 RepID=UPI000271B66E|nr:hypothetical protein [Paraburkholderia hospita]EUC12348.1 hypothetical protein PMI06_008731 [Burkholderia sp. BT03]SKC51907.1 hypothetical protein SAMN06266956_0472 [Paraburkholderia hospita]
MTAIKTGNFVHVVATVNTNAKAGKILYVNPSTSTVQSDAPLNENVQLVIQGNNGQELHRQAAVVRQSSCENPRGSEVGLIQADLPRLPGMRSVLLTVNNKEVSRYDAGTPVTAPQAAGLGLAGAASDVPHRRQLTLTQAADLQPIDGVTYAVEVKPDNGSHWNTIAIGRATPNVEVDRNQFAGARTAEVRVLRTTGFDEEVIAHETVDLF